MRAAADAASHSTTAAATATFNVTSACDDNQFKHPEFGTCEWDELLLFESRREYGRYHVTPAVLSGVKRGVKRALGRHSGCGMTEHQLAAWMLAIGFWETLSTAQGTVTRDVTIAGVKKRITYADGNNMREPARSLMTLSRGDYYGAGPREVHKFLYPDDVAGTEPKRAFWHPGVGYWQLDWWPLDLNHAERADVDKGGARVALYLAERCAAGQAQFDRFLLNQWNACKKDSRPCHRTYDDIYLGGGSATGHESLYVTTANDAAHRDTDGGVKPLGMGTKGCRWGPTGQRFDCWLYDTSNAEGHTDSDPSASDVIGTTGRSPLAAPFVSFTYSGFRYAVFPESFTGGDVTMTKRVPVGNDQASDGEKKTKRVRTAGGGLWDRDPVDGSAGDSVVQVLVCSADAVNEHQDCSWVPVNDGRFKPSVRARFP